ncbi:MAG: UvrD-helicase domain-containing protein [Treponema sp.]|nr:UvrD-helicase domain-containing protein [Treponema sp.]
MSIEKSSKLNEEQKKAVVCGKNAVVAAGAGSGKTRVLANRYVWLLTEKDYKVDQILTLTFTRKAAAEMFKRIYSEIKYIAEKETGIKAKRAGKAIEDFIHARIQTLDSYSASIVRQCAPRYGITPDFKIDKEQCKQIALEISYPFFIEHRNHPAIERLYSVYQPEKIVDNIFADILYKFCNIDKPRDFFADIKKQFKKILEQWKDLFDKTIDLLNKIESDILTDNSLLPVLVEVMEKYVKAGIEVPQTEDLKKYFDYLLSVPGEDAIEKSEAHPLQKNITLFLRFINLIGCVDLRGGKKSGNPVKENIKLLRDLFGSLSSIGISCMQSGFIISVMSLLSELQTIYFERKRAQGILSYYDVANLSRTILIEQKDIRQSEKETFKAIMIDEFQDNNELQKDILFLLAENLDVKNNGIPSEKDICPDKLFFVGDEKQSIYLFRGADVSVFRKLKDELKCKELYLKTNYRSAPHLISAFNTIFGSVFAPSKSLPLYEASYSPLEAGIEGEGSISFYILNSHKGKDEEEERLTSDENEAQFVANKIKQLLKEKYQPHEIAILFRTGSAQHYFEKHLRSLDIPYTCENIKDIFYGGLVNDLMSVLRLVSHPTDSASYAETLRSPFAGLSIAGTALCLSLFCNEGGIPFDDKPLEHLDKTDGEKYKSGQNVYSAICKKAESFSISSLVSELWYNEGYRYETEWDPYTSVYREMFDYLFHYAAIADSENETLASFTDSMISNRENGSELSEIELPLERPSAVRLTTIHKSKGLEYPVVFLCCCGKKSLLDTVDVVYDSGEVGIVFSPPPPLECRDFAGKRNNYFWDMASEETRRKRTAELRRLLYVGMTRAEKELHITGAVKINDYETKDFSLKLKNYIAEKCSSSDNYIENDSILDNDTFMGLLLPSIAGHIPEEGHKNKKSFFNLEEIPVFYKTDAPYSGISINNFIKKTSVFYKKTETITTPFLLDNHFSPVSLRKDKEDEIKNLIINTEFSGSKSDDIFGNIDAMILGLSKGLSPQDSDDKSRKFNHACFGTIAHACVEASLKKEGAFIPSNIACLLNDEQSDVVLKAGMEIAKRFMLSPLGKTAENAKLCENEFPFKSIIRNKEGKEAFINGTIDLFFEDNGCIHVVDLKTDSYELPKEHAAQMSCYYNAVTDIFAGGNKECRVWLYYLRTGHAVEMTEIVKQFDIEQRVFNI